MEDQPGTERRRRCWPGLRWAVQGLLLVAVGLLLAACHQNGTEFVVDTTADTVDASPGPHEVCVFAINQGVGNHILLRCDTIG